MFAESLLGQTCLGTRYAKKNGKQFLFSSCSQWKRVDGYRHQQWQGWAPLTTLGVKELLDRHLIQTGKGRVGFWEGSEGGLKDEENSSARPRSGPRGCKRREERNANGPGRKTLPRRATWPYMKNCQNNINAIHYLLKPNCKTKYCQWLQHIRVNNIKC